MGEALTPLQPELLRRIRKGLGLWHQPGIDGLMYEVAFLQTFGLIRVGTGLEVGMTALGSNYLAAADGVIRRC